MCGIVGSTLKISQEQKSRAVASIKHRGPDAQGEYCDDNIWLGHVRLSILDLSDNASQPMATADSRYVICYNGEVYNYAEIANSLGLTGLRTHSDTEVILQSFAKLGVNLLERLNGMFAFAIYDKQDKKIWLVRDHLGIKPLYYQLDKDSLLFASEIKALLCINNKTSFQCNFSAVHEWLYYGNALGEQTLYQNINKLLPGHYLELDLSTFDSKIVCYWSPAVIARSAFCDEAIQRNIEKTGLPRPAKNAGLAMTARNLLEQAVRRQLVSDVPVGVFLSGGVDSSAITAFASRHYAGKLATYSAGFDFNQYVDELPQARKIAKLYNTDHHELSVSGIDIADTIIKMVEHHDMPFSDAANIPLYLLSSKINGATKVILQGDGGDEMFGGYRRYTTFSFFTLFKLFARARKLFSYFMPRSIKYYQYQRYGNALTTFNTLAETFAILMSEEDIASDVTAIFAPEMRREIAKFNPFARYIECQKYFANLDIVNQMLLIDSMIILPDIFLEKVDRSTMAGSIEARVPFLDNDLVEFCMQLSGKQKVNFGRKKWLLKKALQGIVPNDVLYGKKAGFGVPYGNWLRLDSIKSLFFAQLDSFLVKHPEILNTTAIHSIYNEHYLFKRDRAFLLWKILNFMIWANIMPVYFL